MTHKRRDRRPRWLQALDALHRIELRLQQLQQGQFAERRRLARIEQALNLNTVNDIMTREALVATKEDLLAAVAANTEIDQSIRELLDANTQLLRDALADNGVDSAVIDDVIAQLTADTNADVDAVVRNTIADPNPTEIPGGNVPDDSTDTPPVDQPTDGTDGQPFPNDQP